MYKEFERVQKDLQQRTKSLFSRLIPLADEIRPQLTPILQLDLQTLIQSMQTFQEKLDKLPKFNRPMNDQELRVVRHDLKNVLNVMVGFAFVMQRDITELISEQQLSTLKTILSDSQALIEVVDQLR